MGQLVLMLACTGEQSCLRESKVAKSEIFPSERRRKNWRKGSLPRSFPDKSHQHRVNNIFSLLANPIPNLKEIDSPCGSEIFNPHCLDLLDDEPAERAL